MIDLTLLADESQRSIVIEDDDDDQLVQFVEPAAAVHDPLAAPPTVRVQYHTVQYHRVALPAVPVLRIEPQAFTV